jgi:hypothetical protein
MERDVRDKPKAGVAEREEIHPSELTHTNGMLLD